MVLGLLACRQMPATIDSVGEDGPGPPQLPFPPQDRVALADQETYVNGDEFIDASSGVAVSQGSATLTAQPGQMTWAIYRLPTNAAEVVEFGVNFSSMATPAWVGVSNYQRGGWDFGQPLSSFYQDELTTANLSPDNGAVYVAVVAYDSCAVKVLRLYLTLNLSQWYHSMATYDQYYCTGIRAFSSGPAGYVSFVFSESVDSSIYYARALTAHPFNDYDWQFYKLRAGEAGAAYRGPVSACSIAGRPAVAYYELNSDQLCYSYATTAEPTSAADWVHTVADGQDGEAYPHISLTEFAGGPRLLFARNSPPVLLIAQAATSTPQDADWTTCWVNTNISWMGSLSVIDGQLASTYVAVNGGIPQYWYAQTASSWPLGPLAWNSANFTTADYQSMGSLELIAIAQGTSHVPLIALLDETPGHLTLYRGLVSRPASVTDWASQMLVGFDIVENVSIAAIKGRAAVAYVEAQNDNVCFQWARSEQPATSEDWSLSYVDGTTSGRTYNYLSLTDVNGVPVLVYFDTKHNYMMCAYYK